MDVQPHHPLQELLAQLLFSIETVPQAEQKRMVNFACKEAVKWHQNEVRAHVGEHMRYIGVLGLLSQCSVYVPEDLRECIESAMIDAVSNSGGTLKWKRVLDRIELETQNV